MVDHVELKVDASGRLVIPAELLEILGWSPDTTINFEISGEGLRLEPHHPAQPAPLPGVVDPQTTLEMSTALIRALTGP